MLHHFAHNGNCYFGMPKDTVSSSLEMLEIDGKLSVSNLQEIPEYDGEIPEIYGNAKFSLQQKNPLLVLVKSIGKW